MRWDIKFDEEKAMRFSLERALDLHVEEELLVPKNERQEWSRHMWRIMEWKAHHGS